MNCGYLFFGGPVGRIINMVKLRHTVENMSGRQRLSGVEHHIRIVTIVKTIALKNI